MTFRSRVLLGLLASLVVLVFVFFGHRDNKVQSELSPGKICQNFSGAQVPCNNPTEGN